MDNISPEDEPDIEKKDLFQRSTSPKAVKFAESIALDVQHVSGSTYSPQKKIGPLGRKRLQSGSRSFIRGAPSQQQRQRTSLPERKQSASFESTERMKKKRLGLGLTRKRKPSDVNKSNENSERINALTPKGPKSIRSLFSFTRTWSSRWSEDRPRINVVDNLDGNGLASLHIAAENNEVASIHDLIQRNAVVNNKKVYFYLYILYSRCQRESSVDEATPLHMAARYNCPDAAEVLLQYGGDVTDCLTNGQTPLHVCCRRGFLKVVKILILNGKADVNSRDKDKTTPLHQATIHGNVDVCTFLIDNGAQIRAKDINHLTPMMQASQSGFEECVQLILIKALQSGIPLDDFLSDKDNEGNTALHLAVGNRHINVSRSLIERGTPVNCQKITNGYTPLHQAAIIGEEALAQMLIDKGAKTEVVDHEQMTPLHRATMFNRVETVLLLIRQGLYLETKDEDNFTPLLTAAWKDQTEAGRTLLRYGADIKAVDKQMKTCLHWAAEMQHLEFAKMLFEHGHGGDEIVNWKDRAEQTPLHLASEVGNSEIIRLLIENGATPDVKDGYEKAPLHIASQSGHLECAEVLLQACPIPLNDDDIDDMTPLLLASENGHYRVVKFLLKMGADIASRNDDRRCALALAAKNNELEVLNVLIENNADVNAMDKDRNTALHLCAQFGHEVPTKLLLNSGADLRLQNVYGKYPLDMAIENKHEAVAVAMLSCKSWEVAMNNIDASGHSPMRRLIASLPEAALLVMDKCITYSHDDHNHPDLKVTYDYRYVDPGPDDISYDKNKKRYFALETMVEFRREKLLAHRLSQTSLSKKWNSFARYLNYMAFLFYLGFIVAVSACLRMHMKIYNANEKDENGCPIVQADYDYNSFSPYIFDNPYYDGFYYNESHYMSNESQTFGDPFGDIYWVIYHQYGVGAELLQVIIFLFTFIWGIIEVIKMLLFRVAYFKKISNYLHWCMIIPTFNFTVYGFPFCAWSWVWGAVAVFVTWVNFIFILNRFDFFGLYVTMFFTTLKSLLKAMSVYIFFIVGFAMAFFICFQEKHDSFKDELKSILTTFVMTLCEINKSDLLDDKDIDLKPFEEVATILMIIFLFVMPMVLNNLTIGIAVGDIEDILDSSYYKRFSLQVDIILSTEKGFPRWLQRKFWFAKAEYCPNKQWKVKVKADSILNRSNTKFLRKSKGESDRIITVIDVMKGVERNESSISTLATIIQEQGKLLRRIAEKHDIKVDLEDLATRTIASGTHGKSARI